MLAVPGAFTPTCSMKHLPGFVEKYDEIKAKGVDTIACVGVNDAFVMDAWGKNLDVGDKILLLADGSAIFTKVCPGHLTASVLLADDTGMCRSGLLPMRYRTWSRCDACGGVKKGQSSGVCVQKQNAGLFALLLRRPLVRSWT